MLKIRRSHDRRIFDIGITISENTVFILRRDPVRPLEWARWRLKSAASRLFTRPFIQAQIKGNIKAPRHWPLWGEFTGHQWWRHHVPWLLASRTPSQYKDRHSRYDDSNVYMGIPILVRRHVYIETIPGSLRPNFISSCDINYVT